MSGIGTGSPEAYIKSMDLTQLPTFDPSRKTTTGFSQLHSLDLFPGLGLAPEDFWETIFKVYGLPQSDDHKNCTFSYLPRSW